MKLIDKIKIVYSDLQERIVIKNFITKHRSELDQQKRKKILIWALGGLPPLLIIDGIISLALQTRGHETLTIICDGTPKICLKRGLGKNEKLKKWTKSCRKCVINYKRQAKKLNLNFRQIKNLITKNKKAEFETIISQTSIKNLYNYEYLGVPIGKLAYDSFNRYMKGHLIKIDAMNKKQQEIFKTYILASLINTEAAYNVVNHFKPQAIWMSHGTFVDYGPALFIGQQTQIRTSVWCGALERQHLFIDQPKGKNKLNLRAVTAKTWTRQLKKELTNLEKQKLNDYFHNRYFKNKSSDIDMPAKPENPTTLKRRLGFKNENPIWCIFAHVNWDACFNYSPMIFKNPNLWIIQTINIISKIKNINWLIKIHPGEVIDGTISGTGDLIKAKFKNLPEHIKIIPPQTNLNSYGLYKLINGGITIFGTIGLELAMLGVPVIVAGEAYYSNKDFTYDAHNYAEYKKLLDNAKNIKPLSEAQTKIAQKYAYLFFIQRQIPLKIIKKNEDMFGPLEMDKLNLLLPGQDRVIDMICDKIINGGDFMLD